VDSLNFLRLFAVLEENTDGRVHGANHDTVTTVSDLGSPGRRSRELIT
jgi:hypothetical protein